MKILVVEDNARVARFVTQGLREAGHTVDHVDSGRDGMLIAARDPHDVIVLDRMLPGNIDGLAIIEALRKAGNRTPILILSALDAVDERIRGLRAGGDDYLSKPFAFGELLARVDALGRRSAGSDADRALQVGDLRMDLLTRKVTRGSRVITLQPREFKLLEWVEIAVADDGPGTTATGKPRATERFFRGDTSRGTPGVGLGLAIVDTVAKLHGGALQLLDNHPGLRAQMVLPVAAARSSR